MNNFEMFLTGVVWGLNILVAPTALDKEIKSQELIIVNYQEGLKSD